MSETSRPESAEKSGRVVVVGSVNEDLSLRVAALPRPGETVLSSGWSRHPGGKGANQAVAAARAGATVALIAAIGDDDAGERNLLALRRDRVDVSGVVVRPQDATGMAVVATDRAGENEIIVASGANSTLTGMVVAQTFQNIALGTDDIVVLNFEIPEATVLAAVAAAVSVGALVIVNASPVRSLAGVTGGVRTILVVNEGEARRLAPDAPTAQDAGLELAQACLATIVTRGSEGALLCQAGSATVVPTTPRQAVDTTGAGDTFAGTLAAALVAGHELAFAIRFALAAASLSITTAGARAGMPTLTAIEAELAGQ